MTLSQRHPPPPRYPLAMDRDTPAIQRARYHDLLRGQAPHQRLRAAIALTTAVRELAVAGLRSRHPGSSDREERRFGQRAPAG